MSPTQCAILTIVTDAEPQAHQLYNSLKQHGIRVITDYRNEKISYKVREHMTQGVPVLAVIGKKEAENGTISLRVRGSNEQITLTTQQFIQQMVNDSTPPDLLNKN
jgi:threonyl-tRNA synthetase